VQGRDLPTTRGRRDLVADLGAHVAAGRPAFVVLADLDDLRTYNAEQGLDAGDRLIALTSATVEAVAGATAYRYGGDSFALVFCGDPAQVAPAALPALALLAGVTAPRPMPCAFGAVHLPGDTHDPARALGLAERRLDEQQARFPRYEDRVAEVLGTLVEAVSPGLHRRVTDVADLATRVAARLGAGSAERDVIRRAAGLHALTALGPTHEQLADPACLPDTAQTLRDLGAALAEAARGATSQSAQVLAACVRQVAGEPFDVAGADPRVVTALNAQLESVDLPAMISVGTGPAEGADAGLGGERLAALARLHGLLDAAGTVDDPRDLPRALEAIAQAVSETLGFREVVINLYRPEWDDFIVSTVCGSDEVRHSLLGSTYEWSVWEDVLDARFEQRGTYPIYAGQFDWDTQGGRRYVPHVEVGELDADAWHPEDEVFAPFTHSDGHLLGIFNVGGPISGRRPSAVELDTLVVVVRHAARAVERAQLATAAAAHRRGLERLLQISIDLTKTDSAEDVLQAVADGTADALRFAKVAVHLAGADGAHLTPVAWAGPTPAWTADALPVSMPELATLFAPAHETAGCYLIGHDEVHARLPQLDGLAPSTINGAGPRAWNRHWLLVPLIDRDGTTTGVILADDPIDRLLPTTERLQAMRLFANQAANALQSLSQQEQLRFLADRDPLTKLLNRRALMEHLQRATARAGGERRALALAYCDLDGFKALNDRLGHAAGDRLLQDLAAILEAAIRDDDRAFRVGGDEFALLLDGCDRERALAVVHRVLERLSALSAQLPSTVAASFGIVAVDGGEATDPESLLHRADQAMYEAKRGATALRVAA
jgi:diguanylate cyclase (GGDEF)-like protein